MIWILGRVFWCPKIWELYGIYILCDFLASKGSLFCWTHFCLVQSQTSLLDNGDLSFWKGSKNFVQMVQVTQPRRPSCLFNVKSYKNLLQNQKSYDFETWHAASRTQAVQNDDPGLTLTILPQGQILSPMLLNKSFNRKNMQQMIKLTEQGVAFPCHGAIYIYLYMTFIFKYLWNPSRPINAKFYLEPPLEGST